MHLYCGQVKTLTALSPHEITQMLLVGAESNNLAKEDFNKNEIATWGKSISKLITYINQAGLSELTIVLEYFVPGNLLRVDAVLIGYNKQSDLEIMLIEMKEWGSFISSPDAHNVDIGMGEQPIRQHPAAQLNHYMTSLKCYHSELQKNKQIKLSCLSFMPNFTMKEKLFDPPHDVYKKHYYDNCFTKGESDLLVNHLKSKYSGGQVSESDIELFINGQYSMSEASIAGIAKALNGERFVALLDEQRDVKVKAMELIDHAFAQQQQLVLIINGEAGTGKTVLGLDLIRQYIKKYPDSYFGTIPQTLRVVIDGFNKDYAAANDLDEPARLPVVKAILEARENGRLVVIDEAHRLTDVKDAMRKLCAKFQVIVLLQDDRQRIKISERGTIHNIAGALGYEPIVLKLSSQQRAQNSGTFTHNIDVFLEGCMPDAADIKSYELHSNQSLHEIDFLLKQKNVDGYSVKWLAPYCWAWDGKKNDIEIVDYDGTTFTKAWNPTVAAQYNWFRGKDAAHIDQVGCIYTAQGLEFDYVGFIFWDDLKYDAKMKRWKVSLKKNYDYTFVNEIVKVYGGTYEAKKKQVLYHGRTFELDAFIELVNATEVVSELVRNIYRVLLTRGKKGLFIWFKDMETKKYFDMHFRLKQEGVLNG